MKLQDITRPDKLLFKGIKTLGSISFDLYSNEKKDAKAKSELTFFGKKKLEKIQSQLYVYNEDSCELVKPDKNFDFIKNPKKGFNYWLNFHGIHDVKIIKKIGDQVDLDRLTLRQILDTTQRPKVENYEHYLYLSTKSIIKNKDDELKMEQMSFVLGTHFVISFQEEKGDHFEGIRNKLREGLGFLRKKKCDYILSQLLDAALDNYFESIDQINLDIGSIEKSVFVNPSKSTLVEIESNKRSAQVIKKSLAPLKEALMSITTGEISLILKENIKFYKDLSNSVSHASEEIESTLKNLEGLTNIYFASLSHRMNETMKMLTTVATIFIPLTFIVGIYGMNFDNMPELRYQYGYFIVWGVMGIVAVAMLIYFRIRKWL